MTHKVFHACEMLMEAYSFDEATEASKAAGVLHTWISVLIELRHEYRNMHVIKKRRDDIEAGKSPEEAASKPN